MMGILDILRNTPGSSTPNIERTPQ